MSDREEKLERALVDIKNWCDAYPEKIFRPVSSEEVKQMADLLYKHGMRCDALHASWARHLLEGIGKIATGALE